MAAHGRPQFDPEVSAPEDGEGANGALASRRPERRWRVSLDVQVLAAMSLIICGSMAGLGYWVSAYTRSIDIEVAAETSAFYMNLLFEPLLLGIEREGVVPPEVEATLDAMLAEQVESGFLETAVIWWRDGTVAYSTDKQMMGQRMPSRHLEIAFGGAVVAELELSDHGSYRQRSLGTPLLEVYVPLHDPRTGAVEAVGEFYRDAAALQAQSDRAVLTIWSIIGATTVLMLCLLILTTMRAAAILRAQRSELAMRLAHSERLAKQNEELRLSAEVARVGAFRTNEDFLNQIGSEVHDGPMQLLTLIMLRLKGISVPDGAGRADETAQEQAKTLKLAEQTMQDLRNIAFGLTLPELDGLSVRDTLMLAIMRHEGQTDTSVRTLLRDLPEQVDPPLKICLYRVVQESLNNAFKHARGAGQRVTAGMRAGQIEVRISDKGPGMSTGSESGRRPGLGLSGLSRRLQTFGGRLIVESRPEGTTIIARLPVVVQGAMEPLPEAIEPRL